jgi:hypothetical protein
MEVSMVIEVKTVQVKAPVVLAHWKRGAPFIILFFSKTEAKVFDCPRVFNPRECGLRRKKEKKVWRI